MELAENLLHISKPVEEPKEEELLDRVDRLEKEIQELKGAIKNMERANGKRILQSEEEEGVIAEVFKKLQSLVGRLGNRMFIIWC